MVAKIKKLSSNEYSYSLDNYVKKEYKRSEIICKKCGNVMKLISAENISDLVVYLCNICKDRIIFKYMLFGLYYKITNSLKLDLLFSPYVLKFYNGISVHTYIQKKLNENKNVDKDKIIREVYLDWKNDQPIKFLHLVALTTKYVPIIRSEFNIIKYLEQEILEQKENLVNFKSIKLSKVKRNKIINKRYHRNSYFQKYVVNDCVKNSGCVVWLGQEDVYKKVIKNTCLKYSKPLYSSDNLNDLLDINFDPNPVYITGSYYWISPTKQNELDEKVDKYLTQLNNFLDDRNKIITIISAANHGIESAVAKWALKNNVYMTIITAYEGQVELIIRGKKVIFSFKQKILKYLIENDVG